MFRSGDHLGYQLQCRPLLAPLRPSAQRAEETAPSGVKVRDALAIRSGLAQRFASFQGNVISWQVLYLELTST